MLPCLGAQASGYITAPSVAERNAWRWIAGANVNLSLASCGYYKMSVGRGSAAPVGAAGQLSAESKGQMESSLGERLWKSSYILSCYGLNIALYIYLKQWMSMLM